MTPNDSSDLEAVARRLGALRAAGVDVERIAERVVERLRAGDTVREPVMWPRVAAAAAVALVLLGGTAVWRGAAIDTTPAVVAVGPVPLGDLESRVLSEVLDSLILAAPAGELAASAILDDLDERQLRELLATMEG